MLKIYDSISRQKNVFVPIEDKKIRLYACGITVYDYCHLGHGRQMVTFDFLTRYLRYRGYDVEYVRNITDIDDKIIKRANENGETIQELTERFIKEMYKDADALGTLRPDKEPKATEYIPQIIAMIETLIEKGFAYASDNGDVYYNVKAFKDYGKLSHQKLEDLQAGTRIDVNENKENPLDFVLWKVAKENEPAWPSPWGDGRPGWHIECSAMSTGELGAHFDIHGGGLDLKFPHHENEIAQSEAATGEKFVNTWMHTGLVQVDDEKMSKSLGNFTTINQALEEYSAEEIRYFMLASHYRSAMSYSNATMKSAKAALDRLYTALRNLNDAPEHSDNDYEDRFIAAMDDDFNTPEALAVFFDIARDINRSKEQSPDKANGLGTLLRRLAGTLGILQESSESYLQAGDDLNTDEIERLIKSREQARADKDWAESDNIRDQLTAMGITLEDGTNGTTWRRAE